VGDSIRCEAHLVGGMAGGGLLGTVGLLCGGHGDCVRVV
jgi:hypothetical protein